MTANRSDFDLSMREGAQGELFVASVRDTLAGKGTVEVKAPKPFLREGSAYVEYECRTRAGVWKPSGIQVTKAALWFFTFGSLPGGLVVETEWLRRAMRHAWQRPRNRKDCGMEPNPTRAVVVSLRDLYATREREP